ncbi:MAG: class I SAM-dependent methyltransferase [Myxococcales bacterium]|nr:class I SAM-dependent methyltransferase [Myxococcales bacterium]MCB9549258.1 class I SAM-dependent methyltransferase [Myxococcales bacterium]
METQSVYDMPAVYDIAFGYRDIPREVEVILDWVSRIPGTPAPRRALELAAGPARHAIELARLGVEVCTLDRSPAMCDYARELAAAAGVEVAVGLGDMQAFQLPAPVDLAIAMLDSVGHLLDLDALVDHLAQVRAALNPGGVYVLEMAHPGDFMTARPRTVTRWVQRRGATEVRIAWGAEGDRFDPTSQTGLATVLMRITDGRGIRTLVDHVTYRRWTATEVEAAARLAGLTSVAWFGALDADTSFSNDSNAWRMIPILQRPR